MTMYDVGPDEHPWYVDFRPNPTTTDGRDADAVATLRALDAIGATMLSVHADTVPSLADVVAGHCYVGWTILVPGSVERRAIEEIVATAGAGYRVTIAPGHPLPPAAPMRRTVTPSSPIAVRA